MSFHAVIEGISTFKQKCPFDPSQVQEVKVAGSARMMEPRFAEREPTSILGAQYSLPFSAAIALYRDITNPSVYSEETLWDAQVRELARRIELTPFDSAPGEGGEPHWGTPSAEVSLTLAGQEQCTLIVTDWKGAPTNPYSFPEMVEKFCRYAAPCLPDHRIQKIVHRVEALEEVGDMADLASLLRGG